MKYEDIPASILAYSRKDKKLGIRTERVVGKYTGDTVALFEAHKSDHTTSLFIAFRSSVDNSEDNWFWWCPGNEGLAFMRDFIEYCAAIDKDNSIRRTRDPGVS
jgi:hypothetical protein